MSRYDETFLGEGEGPEGLVYEEELQRPRTADGEGEERPFTQAGFREEDLSVSTSSAVGTGFHRGLHIVEYSLFTFIEVKFQSQMPPN